MKAVYYRPNGRIQVVADVQAGTEPAPIAGLEMLVVAEADTRPGRQRVVDGAVVEIPPQPSPEHVFDHDAGAWVHRSLHAESLQQQWAAVRAERDRRLAATDFTQLEDSPFDAGQRAQWSAYRAALRNVPGDNADPFAIAWPTPP